MPELTGDNLASRGDIPDRQWLLVLCRVSLECIIGRMPVVDKEDIDRPTDRGAHFARGIAGRESLHTAPFSQDVGHKYNRPADLANGLSNALHQQDRHEAGVEAPGSDDHRVKPSNRFSHGGMHPDLGFQPDASDSAAVRLLRINGHLTDRRGRVVVLSAHAGVLDADRPHAPLAVEQRAERVDGRKEIAAELLHHREQEVATGVAAQASVLETRQTRQQNATGLVLVACQRKRALEYVTWRQHAKLVAQLTGAAPAIEHRDDGIGMDPGVVLEPTDQTGQASSTTETSDVEPAKLHAAALYNGASLALGCMALIDVLLPEYDRETGTTRRLLERIPESAFDFAPHPRSMSLGQLSAHLAELPRWVSIIMSEESCDVTELQPPPPAGAVAPLLARYDANVTAARSQLVGAIDGTLSAPWTLKRGARSIFTMPRVSMLRQFALNHLVHHRGQLSVYLRMQEVSIPAIYGPSADEGSF